MREYRFNHIVAAGSWDHFHLGHEKFLMEAFKISRRVLIGVTSDEMIGSKNYWQSLEKFGQRRCEVKKFVDDNNLNKRAKIVIINDIYGQAITDLSIEAILITKETYKGGEAVNDKRRSLNLKPLDLIKTKMIKNISAKKIRAGLINRQGLVYFNLFDKYSRFILPLKLRSKLSEPFGQLLPGKLGRRPKGKIVCVGDVVTKIFLDKKYKAEQYIVDLKVERRVKYKSLNELGFSKSIKTRVIKNKAGEVTTQLAKAIKENGKVIVVKGEEDLAVLPVVLSVPLGWKVIYGQPKRGVVVVEVTEKKKQEAYNLLNKFKKE